MSTPVIEPKAILDSAYETDFYAWTQAQAALLREGRIQELDVQNLLEELESMGRSERRELDSRLKVLLQHLLKWQFQPDKRSVSWEDTIEEQRGQISRLLKQSPSLKRFLPDALTEEYRRARRSAYRETQLSARTFPDTCPYSVEQVLNEDLWPD